MEAIETTCTVALRDYPELPPKERMAAEARYLRVLERKLGGAEVVAEALRAVVQLQESDGSEASPEDLALAGQWTKAANAAREAGYQGLGEVDGAYFEVRLA
ncbi:hypothetical protein [Acidovorax sp.]|jgi:hypothetical protein|uniref:hypothetical protein n=1 Tax=Acidovorax sp. TaxID=1872122 RepID=UPI002ACD9CC7|nr:hypothetical protein [Acidovorax sp.]MDZ7862086.1 hypothetical protein [Acidovorax sp.]